MTLPNRTFVGTQGNPSTGLQGPEQISNDLDMLFAMFNPNATRPDNESGGIKSDSIGSLTNLTFGNYRISFNAVSNKLEITYIGT